MIVTCKRHNERHPKELYCLLCEAGLPTKTELTKDICIAGETMTLEEMSKCREGKDLWGYYVKINGYAFRPTDEGLKKIARLLDLDMPYIRHRISLYLEA